VALFKILISAVVVSLFIWSCQPDDKATSSSSGGPVFPEKPTMGPATGWINAQPWAFKSGWAYYRKVHFEQFLMVELWDSESAVPCQRPPGTALRIRLKLQPQPGHFDVGSDPFRHVPVIFFVDYNSPIFRTSDIVANIGYVNVDSLTQEVTGEFSGVASDVPRTEVMGSFKVPVCDENHL
jgi:hypothetical protein